MNSNTEARPGGFTYTFLIILLIILGLFMILSSNKLKIPYRVFTVESGSMKPTLNVGDLIFVRDQSDYKVGDVVSYALETKNEVVTHRIADTKAVKGHQEFITKGDYNSVSDLDPVSPKQIIGKYTFKIPIIGYLISFVRTTVGFILILVIPSTIIIYEEIAKIIRTLKHKDATNLAE